MKGFKGFKKGLICRDKQYNEGEIFTEEEAKPCESGMHFCENPVDILKYYGFVDDSGECAELNDFATVEALDEPVTDDGKKYATTKLKVERKLTIHEFASKFAEFTVEKVKEITVQKTSTNTGDRSASTNTGNYSASTNTGDYSASTNTGYRSASTNTGDYSASTNTGDGSASTNTGNYSASTVSGKSSIAVAWGKESKAKGAKGCYIVLAEYDEECNLINARMRKVDGKKIKADTFYTLKDGKVIEAE